MAGAWVGGGWQGQPGCIQRGEQQLKFTEHLLCARYFVKKVLYLYYFY